MCKQTIFRFCIALKETFSKSITFKVIKKYRKDAVAQIEKVVGLGYHIAGQRIL